MEKNPALLISKSKQKGLIGSLLSFAIKLYLPVFSSVFLSKFPGSSRKFVCKRIGDW